MHRTRTGRGMAAVGVAIFAALSIAALGAHTAQAHAFHAGFKSSNPAPNSVLKTDPTQVSITFLQKLDPSVLNITVYGNTAKVVSTGTAQISPTDPYTATVSMKGDGSDIYRVDWNNKSAEDGDPTLGAFVFAVDPSGKSDKVTSTATASSHTTGSAGTPAWVAILTGILGLVVGAAVTFFGVRARAAR